MANINDYLEYIALQDLKTYHYKTLLMLLKCPLTQSMISNRLEIRKQNMNKITGDLERLGYIEVDRVEGRNKFYKIITDIEKLHTAMKGQIKL